MRARRKQKPMAKQVSPAQDRPHEGAGDEETGRDPLRGGKIGAKCGYEVRNREIDTIARKGLGRTG